MSFATRGIPPSLDGLRELPFPVAAGDELPRAGNPAAHPILDARGVAWAGLGRAMRIPGWLARAGVAALRFRAIGLVGVHAALFSLIYLAAYLVRFDGAIPALYARQALATLPLVVGLKLAAFLATGCHR